MNEKNSKMNNIPISPNQSDQEMIVKIKAAVDGLKYGHVQIVIHNSKIVQIDRTEKIRLEL